MKRAVITGLGAITPIGNDVNTYWQNLLSGKSGAAPITHFDTINHKTKFACEVKGFDPLQYFEKQEVKRMDFYTQYALAAADECVKDSGIEFAKCDVNRIGVIIASGVGGTVTFEEEVINFAQGDFVPRFSPFFITKMIANMATGLISIKYGLHGVTYTIVSACASSNNAICNSLDLIRLGRIDAIIVGGAEAPITQSSIGGFNSIKAISTLNDSPGTASRPFDRTRDGFVAGEGAGVLMIEELEHAVKRGAKIYCELVGYGAASDGYHITATHPEGLGAVLAMQTALADAGITAADIDYINAHATSTPVGDISECKAIEKVFRDSLGIINIGATKSMTGHLLGAAGAIEAIACIKAIEQNKIPPTINTKEVDPEFNPAFNFTLGSACSKEVNVAINNTFGFGGHTSTSVFKKYKK